MSADADAGARQRDTPGRSGLGREPPGRWGRLATDEGDRTVETEPGAYEEYRAGVVAAIRGSTPPPVDPADSVEVLRIIEAAFESARTGTVATFEPA